MDRPAHHMVGLGGWQRQFGVPEYRLVSVRRGAVQCLAIASLAALLVTRASDQATTPLNHRPGPTESAPSMSPWSLRLR
ncbi:hypothetical protein GUJ93_ZPchr0006g43174 [Zizania palustris]|uniref:Uncharacterized protein n=1 Tax=Zizania palustris TaxID=103762 RepID=A0A8J5TFJ6_ZIZPA|nr:hypothetical protein GUJ93_ZPchr0006g43174 [Zizania palustris]